MGSSLKRSFAVLLSAALAAPLSAATPPARSKFAAPRTAAPVRKADKPTPVRAAVKADPAPAPAPDAPPNVIESVSVQTSGKFAKVVIQSSRAIKVRDVAQPDNLGLSLYMSEPALCKRPPIEKASGDVVREIRYGYQGARIPEGDPLPLDYINIRLVEPGSYVLSQRDWIFQVEIKPRGTVVTAAAPAQLDPHADTPLLANYKTSKTQAVLPSSPGLQDFLQVGLANHVPLRLAEEEYRLARIRYFESARGLFPSASGRYENSEGTLLKDISTSADDVQFIRREYGLQLGQPIFHSGRLYFAWRQAAAQKKAAGENVKKVRADMIFEITKAYHNLIKSQRALKTRRELMERMDKVIEMTRKKRQLELITESEALGTESQYSQAYYRFLSDEKDIDIARLRLEALLNLPEPLPDTIPDPDDKFDPRNLIALNVPVETFVDLAYTHRPEMLAADYSALAGSYGEKMARADGRLHIDASGFIGKAGGAFKDDPANPFTYKRSWNVGFQAGMYFMGNSVKGTQTKDRSAPDYGETTATNTSSYSANVGFLDGVKLIGDTRQAAINNERAAYDRDQARRNIAVDVREAYYNIQKSKIQLKGAEQELNYRQKDMGISRQKERMNLIEPSQALQAETAYGEAVNGWEEAVSFYKVSLASLEKAVGAPLDSIAELK
jgi:outer membrane protein TolC